MSILLHWRNNEKNQFNRLSHHPSWHVVRHTHSRPCCTHIYNTYMACTEASGTPAYGTVVSPCVPPGEWNRFIHVHLHPGHSLACPVTWNRGTKHSPHQSGNKTENTSTEHSTHGIAVAMYMYIHVHQIVKQKPTTTPF